MFKELIAKVNKDTTLLSKREESDLYSRHLKGDKEATTRLIDAHLRLVLIISLEYSKKHPKKIAILEELFQEGVLGLHQALEKFDPEKDVLFRTYAGWWVRKKIQEHVREDFRTVQYPSYVIDQLTQFRTVLYELIDKNGVSPSSEEIAAIMNLPVKRVEKLRGLLKVELDLDNHSHSDDFDGDGDNYNVIPDIHQESASEHAIRISDIKHLQKTFLRLSDQEKQVLTYRYGLNGGNEKTLEETGIHLGVSTARVQQIEKKGVEKIKKYWR